MVFTVITEASPGNMTLTLRHFSTAHHHQPPQLFRPATATEPRVTRTRRTKTTTGTNVETPNEGNNKEEE